MRDERQKGWVHKDDRRIILCVVDIRPAGYPHRACWPE